MNRWIAVPVFLLAVTTGCMKRTGDVLVLEDGSVLEGKATGIFDGSVVFQEGSASVTGQGRVWTLDGDTFQGMISLEDGVVEAGARNVPADSVMVILWGDVSLEEGSFHVLAGQGWMPTGILLDPGDMLSIRGSGTVVTETGTSTPSGQEEYSSSTALVPGATSGQLVFRVGEDGRPVAAGESWAGESPFGGELAIAVNVPLDGGEGSNGRYTVHVTAGPGGRDQGTTAFYPATSPL